MDKELKEKWLKALRSGEYEQGPGVLCADDSAFCCLGVLCDVAGLEYESKEELGTVVRNYKYGNSCSYRLLPQEFAIKVGLKTDGSFEDEYGEYALTFLNDHHHTFSEIADIIEANF